MFGLIFGILVIIGAFVGLGFCFKKGSYGLESDGWRLNKK